MAVALLVCLACACPPCALGLYEDQAGSFDWHIQNVGPLQHALLHGKQPRAFVGTSERIVAALNLRDGTLAWRRMLDEKIDSLLMADGASLVVSISGGGSRVRAWDHHDGGMRWETLLEQAASPEAAASLMKSKEGDRVAVATKQSLQVRSCQSIWAVHACMLTMCIGPAFACQCRSWMQPRAAWSTASS